MRDKATNVAKIALNPYGYLFERIAEVVAASTGEKGDTTKLELAELRLATEKQELNMRMAEAQARVAQELAIAKRIETSSEVEIEEFYDTNGHGTVGVKGDENSITIGVSGAGQRVSKRIYHFRGGDTGVEVKA